MQMKSKTLPGLLLISGIFLGVPDYSLGQAITSVIQFVSIHYSIDETGQTAALVVERVGDVSDGGSAWLDTVDGSAIAGEDYIPYHGYVEFHPWQTNAIINIPILNDALVEGDQLFYARLIDADPFCCTLGNRPNATVSIRDNDRGVEFEPTSYRVDEQAGTLTIEVVRSGDPIGPVTVDYGTSGTWATPGVDYIAVHSTLSFAEGETNKSITIEILNDAIVEGDETFGLSLLNPTGGIELGQNRFATVLLADNDRGVEFDSWSYTVAETGGVLTVTVMRAGDPTNAFSVDYYTTNASATAGEDYAAQSGTLSFGDGQTNQTLSIPILNDANPEDYESFNLVLHNATDGVPLGWIYSAQISIEDNDAGVQFSLWSYRSNEDGREVTLTVTRAGDPAGPVSVDYATTNGSAMAGADFVEQHGTLHFEAEETEKTVTLSVLDDGLVEGYESFTVVLSNPTGGISLGVTSATTVEILDNESSGPRGLMFSYENVPGSETERSARVALIRTGDTSEALTAEYLTSEGTATVADLPAQGGTLRFAPLEVTKTLVLAVNDDALPEMDEMFYLTLRHLTGADSNEEITAQVTILDDDRPGSLDLTFKPQLSGYYGHVSAFAIQPDGKILAAEIFDSGGGGQAMPEGGLRRPPPMPFSDFVRLNEDGTLDTNFMSSRIPNSVNAIQLDADQSMLVQGSFTSWNATNSPGVARLGADGMLDQSFTIDVPVHEGWWSSSSSIMSMALQPDGKIIISGDFTEVNGVSRPGVARLNRDGSLDASFDPSPIVNQGAASVRGLALQADGKMLINGDFNNVGSLTRNQLARLNGDGTLDTAFEPGLGPDSWVDSAVVQPGGKILVCGWLNNSDKTTRWRIARLQTDGIIDSSFGGGAGPDGEVRSMALQADGRLLITGNFSMVDGIRRNGVARLNADGSLDTSFDPGSGINGYGYSVAIDGQGRILIAGNFWQVNGVLRPGLARLNGGTHELALSPPTRLSDGQVRMTLFTHPGRRHVLEASSNLVDWVEVATYEAEGYDLEVADTGAPGFGHRFYRAALLAP